MIRKLRNYFSLASDFYARAFRDTYRNFVVFRKAVGKTLVWIASFLVVYCLMVVPGARAYGNMVLTPDPLTYVHNGGVGSKVANLTECTDAPTDELFAYDPDQGVISQGGVSECPTTNADNFDVEDGVTYGTVYLSTCDGLGQSPDWPTQNNPACSDWQTFAYGTEPSGVWLSSGNVSSLTSSVGTIWSGFIALFVSAAPILAILVVLYFATSEIKSFFSKRGVLGGDGLYHGLPKTSKRISYDDGETHRMGRKKIWRTVQSDGSVLVERAYTIRGRAEQVDADLYPKGDKRGNVSNFGL